MEAAAGLHLPPACTLGTQYNAGAGCAPPHQAGWPPAPSPSPVPKLTLGQGAEGARETWRHAEKVSFSCRPERKHCNSWQVAKGALGATGTVPMPGPSQVPVLRAASVPEGSCGPQKLQGTVQGSGPSSMRPKAPGELRGRRASLVLTARGQKARSKWQQERKKDLAKHGRILPVRPIAHFRPRVHISPPFLPSTFLLPSLDIF